MFTLHIQLNFKNRSAFTKVKIKAITKILPHISNNQMNSIKSWQTKEKNIYTVENSVNFSFQTTFTVQPEGILD